MQSIVDACSHPLLAPWDHQRGLAISAATFCESRANSPWMHFTGWAVLCVLSQHYNELGATAVSVPFCRNRAGIHVESSGHVTLTMYASAPALLVANLGTLVCRHSGHHQLHCGSMAMAS